MERYGVSIQFKRGKIRTRKTSNMGTFHTVYRLMNYDDIANYAIKIRPYVYGKNIDEVVRFLEEFSCVIFN